MKFLLHQNQLLYLLKMAKDSDNAEVAVVSYGNMSEGFLTLGKTPVWAIVNGSIRILLHKKKYSLDNHTLAELGQGADHAFLVEGFLNTKNPPQDITERYSHIPM